jgi:hypothetical protein
MHACVPRRVLSVCALLCAARRATSPSCSSTLPGSRRPIRVGGELKQHSISVVGCSHFNIVAVSEEGKVFSWGRGAVHDDLEVRQGIDSSLILPGRCLRLLPNPTPEAQTPNPKPTSFTPLSACQPCSVEVRWIHM